MSGDTKGFGGTLSGGIQDVAALLPLLGTDQCERHAGEALAKGYLYGAIIPVSLFGCLGAVKVAFAVFLGTITYPFFGGRWLDDAGFSTPGSVSSMVTIAKGTGRYGAEIAVEKLLKDQNIEDVSLVKEFTLSDGRRTEFKEGSAPSLWEERLDFGLENTSTMPRTRSWIEIISCPSWNTMLIISSFLSAVLGVTPYLYLMSDDWKQPLFWVFPLLRSFGSCICVVAIQLALQLRINRLANLSLEWKKVQQRLQMQDIIDLDAPLVLEQRICQDLEIQPNTPLQILRRLLPGMGHSAKHSSDTNLENGVRNEKKNQLTDEEQRKFEDLLAPDWTLIAYHLPLAVSMGMVVTGYVGCFSLVSQTQVDHGPYVWFGLETALSLLRIFVWGLNPKWDDGTGLSMSLKLQDIVDQVDDFLHITSPYDEFDLKITSDLLGHFTSSPQPFIAYNEENFLGMVTPRVGPLRPLGSPDVTLFYSILFHANRKALCTTVHFTDSRPMLTFSLNRPDSIFTSALETNPLTRAVQITISNEAMKNIDSFIKSSLYRRIVDHCQRLSTRLFRRQQIECLAVKWTIDSAERDDRRDTNTVTSGALSKYDRTYIALRKAWTAKSKYCKARQDLLESLRNDDEYCKKDILKDLPASFYGEMLFVVESVILELQLWGQEMALSPQQTLPECIRTMHSRILAEKRAVKRYNTYNWPRYTEELTREWDNIQSILVELRESKEKQGHARKIISHNWSVHWASVNELEKHLRDLFPSSLLFRRPARSGIYRYFPDRNLLHFLSSQISASTPLAVDVTPTPKQKLYAMLRLSFIRLNKFRSTGPSIADIAEIADSLCHPPDSASWDPYVNIVASSDPWGGVATSSDYTLNVLSTLVDSHHVLQLDPTSLSISRNGRVVLDVEQVTRKSQEGAESHENPGREGGGRGFDAEGETSITTTQKIFNSKTLTTLIPSDDTFDDKTREKIDNCIKNSTNIISLAGTQCHIPGQDCNQQHCQSIFVNRQRWKEVRDKSAFKYRVGFEGYNREDVNAKGDHIELRYYGRCFALFHCPSPGELKITLNVRRRSETLEFKATLLSDVDGSEGREPVTYQLPVR